MLVKTEERYIYKITSCQHKLHPFSMCVYGPYHDATKQVLDKGQNTGAKAARIAAQFALSLQLLYRINVG